MSRRSLLATAGGGPVVIPDPLPGDGDPGTEPPESLWGGWPIETDETLIDLRPHGRRLATGSVGIVGATHDNISDAATDAKVQAEALGGDGALYWDGKGPDYRYDILIGPGTYDTSLGGGSWGCYVGTTGDPTDVIIQSGLGNNGTLHSFGSQYIEAITLRAFTGDGDGSPKYPWHITGGPVTVACNVIFDASDAISGPGNRTAGLVGKDSSTLTVFYRCTFIGSPDTNVTGFNMHGGDAKPLPETAIFLDCDFIGMTTVGSIGERALDGSPSRLYIIGCTFDDAMTTIAAAGTTEVYTDTDYPVSNAAATYRNVTSPPAIEDGMIAELAAYYYPSVIGDEPTTHTIAVTDTAPMQPVVGRTYITLVPLEEAARITTSGVTCTVAAGQLQLRHVPASTPEDVELPPVTAMTPDQNVTVGSNSWLHLYAYTRYPGSRGIWVSVEFSSATARVNASTDLAGLTDCYYSDDGVTLVPVTAGTSHPLPFIRGT